MYSHVLDLISRQRSPLKEKTHRLNRWILPCICMTENANCLELVQNSDEQRLVELVQGFVDPDEIVISVQDKVLYDDVEFGAVRERKAGAHEQVLCLLQRQLQRDGKTQHGGLGGAIAAVGANL